jgi:hypothetical protein
VILDQCERGHRAAGFTTSGYAGAPPARMASGRRKIGACSEAGRTNRSRGGPSPSSRLPPTRACPPERDHQRSELRLHLRPHPGWRARERERQSRAWPGFSLFLAGAGGDAFRAICRSTRSCTVMICEFSSRRLPHRLLKYRVLPQRKLQHYPSACGQFHVIGLFFWRSTPDGNGA